MKIRHQFYYWMIVTAILTLAFGVVNHDYLGAFYFVTFLLPVIFITSFVYEHYLIPGFLLKRKYLKFILYSLYTLIFSLYLEMLAIFLSFILIAHYRYEEMPVETSNILLLTLSLYFFIVVKIFIRLLSGYLSREAYVTRLESERQKQDRQYFIVRASRENKRIAYQDVSYIESLGDYVQIVTTSGNKITTREKISKLQKHLPDRFVRIHRSFIVNRDYVVSFTREHVSLKDFSLPVGRTFKKNLELLQPRAH